MDEVMQETIVMDPVDVEAARRAIADAFCRGAILRPLEEVEAGDPGLAALAWLVATTFPDMADGSWLLSLERDDGTVVLSREGSLPLMAEAIITDGPRGNVAAWWVSGDGDSSDGFECATAAESIGWAAYRKALLRDYEDQAFGD